ncbi:MAG: motility associated factor glycosyltransferase family protein, partial [Leptospira sp.]|nr:motility associated factor glycosyltransferase family protein [Leptospira sp.]
MHSSRNPTAEAERFAKESFQQNSSQYIVLFGCGALHHFYAIHKIIQYKIQDKANYPKYILALEPLKEVFEDTEFQEQSQILKSAFITLGIELDFFHTSEKENYAKFIQDWLHQSNEANVKSQEDPSNRSLSIELLAFPFYKRNFLDHWLDIQEYLHGTLQQKSTNENTIQTFAKLWTSNFFKNLQDLEASNQLPILSPPDNPLSHGKSLLFIGGGPNLEEQIETIKKHRNEFYILSSDTAIRFLISNELIPDGLISVDSGRGTFFHIPDTLPPGIQIFTWMGACRKLFNFKNRISFFLTTHPLDQALQQFLGLDDRFILKNPSLNIAGIAIALAEFWKFSTVYLSGFALRAIHGKTHCRATGYESFYLPKINRRNTLYSLYPSRVYGKNRTSKNKNSYEELIKPRSFLRVIDFDQFVEENVDTNSKNMKISESTKSSITEKDVSVMPVQLFPIVRSRDLQFFFDKKIHKK